MRPVADAGLSRRCADRPGSKPAGKRVQPRQRLVARERRGPDEAGTCHASHKAATAVRDEPAKPAAQGSVCSIVRLTSTLGSVLHHGHKFGPLLHKRVDSAPYGD